MRPFAILASILLLACGGTAPVTDGELPPGGNAQAGKCDLLAEEFPYFACYHLEAGRNMFLFTSGTTGAERGAVVQRIRGHGEYGEDGSANPPYQYREVEYGYAELLDARQQGLEAVGAVGSVHQYQVDVIGNRVRVAIDEESARTQVENAWSSQGLSLDMLSISVEERAYFL